MDLDLADALSLLCTVTLASLIEQLDTIDELQVNDLGLQRTMISEQRDADRWVLA
jgi:hypothetical protein